ncbi:MAG: polysaccharide biosynthesis tyrosine autokinase [Catenibacterium sp.]|uniref:polysaccharide biosynthesis tyrosine autokinase n=1 Tax=Catenibacterium sp. TaxID=2049022 RepID=UPI001EB6B178|nr:polysaccharide biosynthesis tyrosine autokinase [Catenibacterium sp.]MBS5592691.1 polysaccharide biosynthesis tyrosine autokinase [Catenibacterium sp.]
MENNVQNENLLTIVKCIIKDILQRWILIVAVMIVFGSVFDFMKTVTYVPQYGTSMTATLSGGEDTFKNIDKVQSYVNTLDYLMNSNNAKSYVKKKMPISKTTYKAEVTLKQANVVKFKVTADTKREAYFSIKYLNDWYRENTERYSFPYNITVLKESKFSTKPVNPNSHIKNFLIGAVGSGFVLSCLFGLYFFLRDTIKSEEEVENKLDTRLYAKLPYEVKKREDARNKKAILITSLKTSFFFRESMNKLRSKVEASSDKHGYKSFMITSAYENEGKSSVAANLALALAKNGRKVVLVDADFNNPAVFKIFDLDGSKSLNKAIEGTSSWSSQIVSDRTGLDLLPCSQDTLKSEILTNSKKLDEIMKELREEYDFVIVDTSPAYLLNETMAMNELVDATLFVVRQDYATSDVINETVKRLTYVKDNVLGVVFKNVVSEGNKGTSNYNNRYGYNKYRVRGDK